MPKAAVLALVLGIFSAPLQAQEYLDRGTFVLHRGDAETGRIEFAVRATTGQRGEGGLLVIGTTRTPSREVQYILEVSRDQAPVSYQMTETSGGHVTRRMSALIAGPRFSARATTDAGEVSRELPVRSPLMILAAEDYTVFHFAPRPDVGESRPINIIRTETLAPTTGSVTGEADDSVRVGGRQVACRRYLLRLADGESRQFWITPMGSLLQVTAAAGGIIATRTEAPAR
jgi:hypothetical protein